MSEQILVLYVYTGRISRSCWSGPFRILRFYGIFNGTDVLERFPSSIVTATSNRFYFTDEMTFCFVICLLYLSWDFLFSSLIQKLLCVYACSMNCYHKFQKPFNEGNKWQIFIFQVNTFTCSSFMSVLLQKAFIHSKRLSTKKSYEILIHKEC